MSLELVKCVHVMLGKKWGLELVTLVTSSSPSPRYCGRWKKYVPEPDFLQDDRRMCTAVMWYMYQWPHPFITVKFIAYSFCRSHKVVCYRVYAQRDAVLYTHFTHEFGHMGFDRALFDRQNGSDLFVGPTDHQ